MAKVYPNGTIVSVPEMFVPRSVERSAQPLQKCFGISFSTKQKVLSAAHIQHTSLRHERGINHCFLTPTFSMDEPETYIGKASNEAMGRFCDSLTKTYGITSFVWVKEFTENLTPHYHMLVTMPKVPIKDLNKAWGKARGSNSPNALRTGWNPKTKKAVMRVNNYRQAVGYAAKYIGKGAVGDISVLQSKCSLSGPRLTWGDSKTGHSTKCYGMTRNLSKPALNFDLNYFFALNPEHRRHFREVPKNQYSFADLYFPELGTQAADNVYKFAEYMNGEVKKFGKTEQVKPKKHPSNFDQLSFRLSS